MGHCWLGGQVLPRPSVFRWARYLCVEFACSPGVHKNPNSTLSYQSLTKMDGSLHLVSGRLKAALGSWRKDNPGWENAEIKFTATSGLRVCVCVLCHHYICTCVLQCVVLAVCVF